MAEEKEKSSFSATMLGFITLAPIKAAYAVFVLWTIYNWHAPHFSLPAASAGHVLAVCTAKIWWGANQHFSLHEIAERIQKKPPQIWMNFLTGLLVSSILLLLGWIATKLY